MKVSDPLPIRLLTHNIRYATNAPFKGEEMWVNRRAKIVNELRFNTAHCPESFICLQEVLHKQLTDILSDLNSKCTSFDYVGVGRDDGDQAGECRALLLLVVALCWPNLLPAQSVMLPLMWFLTAQIRFILGKC